MKSGMIGSVDCDDGFGEEKREDAER